MQNQALANEAVQVALTQVGVREASGHNDGRSVSVYQDFVGGGLHGQPWCACFVSWCIHQAALRLGQAVRLGKTASSQMYFAEARALGLLLPRPIPGCIGLIRAGASHDHTFLVEAVDEAAGVVHTVDGNWGNAVCRTTHPIRGCDWVAVV